MKSRVAVWGTGGGALIISGEIGNVDFFIENDITRLSKTFLGKKVYYVKEVEDWDDILVYIYPKYYNEISYQLKSMGLKENIDFLKFSTKIKVNEIPKEIEDFKKKINENSERLRNASLIFSPHLFTIKGEEYKQWFNLLFSNMKTEKFVLFSNYIGTNASQFTGDLNCSLVYMPEFWSFSRLPEINEEISVSPKVKDLINQNERLHDIADCIRFRFSYNRIPENYEYVYIYSVYKVFSYIIETLRPTCIFLWPFSSHTSNILSYICDQEHIRTYALHEGVLYGTFQIDPCGEGGESFPAAKREKFSRLPISEQDINNTKSILDDLMRSGYNRRLQPFDENEMELRKLKKDRPIITFLGDDDFGMCLVPSSRRSKENFSPIFESGLEEAVYIARLAQKNNWNFVYKPHPGDYSYKQEMLPQDMRENVIFIDGMNIHRVVEFSDVIIINVSSCGYIALMKGKPVVETGKNMYTGYGCSYEVGKIDDLEEAIKEAIKMGYKESMREAFEHHMTLLLKYYLYKGGEGTQYYYGVDIPSDMGKLTLDYLAELITER